MNIKNLLKNLTQKVKELEYKLGLIADYVVETGTSGSWTYEKWQSGKAVCWGTDTHTHNISGSWGSIFYTANNTYFLTYPSGLFNSTPKCFAFPDFASGTCWLMDYGSGSGNAGTATRTPSFTFGRGTSSSSVQITLNVEAIGTWK